MGGDGCVLQLLLELLLLQLLLQLLVLLLHLSEVCRFVLGSRELEGGLVGC